MHVLVVEDDARLAEALARILQDNGYATDVVHDGEAGVQYGGTGTYDVIILDVMLPKADGFTVAQRLRRAHVSTPILLLTARDAISDKICGYDSGADDYMTKPFSPEELLARVRALSRRQGDVVLEEMRFADLVLNLSTYTLHCAARSVHLGFKEFEVLRLLMANPAVLVQKEDLLTRVWGYESGAEDNNVEAYISFLRKKFTFLGSRVGIATVRRVGYRLVEGEIG